MTKPQARARDQGLGTTARLRARPFEFALLLAAAIGMASAWPLGAIAAANGSPTLVSARRYITALVVVGLASLWMRRQTGRRVPREAVAPLLAMGVSVALYNLVFITGLRLSNPTSGALIVSGSMPVAAAIVGWASLGERVRARQGAGIATAIAGVATVLVAGGGGSGVSGFRPADGIFVVGGVIWGVNAVLSRWALRHVDPLAATVWSIAFGLTVLLPMALLVDGPHAILAIGPSTWTAVLLGLCSTAIPLICLLAAMRSLGVTRTAAASFLVPVFAVVFDLYFLNQPVSGLQGIGGLLAIGGFLLITM